MRGGKSQQQEQNIYTQHAKETTTKTTLCRLRLLLPLPVSLSDLSLFQSVAVNRTRFGNRATATRRSGLPWHGGARPRETVDVPLPIRVGSPLAVHVTWEQQTCTNFKLISLLVFSCWWLCCAVWDRQTYSKHRFPAPSSKLSQNRLHHWRGSSPPMMSAPPQRFEC